MTKKFVFKKKKKKPTSEIIKQLEARYNNIDVTKIKKFTDLPLTKQTLKGLREQNYVEMTDIQKQSIPLVLKNHDVLGAAQTGSGKTLAFLVPILERLYCNNWTHVDGLGALIITPTRELGYQIAETLRKVGMYHNFSIGLIMGGKNADHEKDKLQTCNILVATPGRLLHHLETNSAFESSYLKIVVLDEADRILDMGFKQTMDCIIEYLPAERQTLLFSATQTKSVKDLARLSLKDPLYVSVHENASTSTPDGLQQSYIVCELEEKLGVLYSFLCNHSKQKIIVFFSSCNQVKFMHEAFCHLRPGISLLSIYGKQSQLKRTTTYQKFHNKEFAALFCTDVAARGLDFPNIDWVIQMDCPEDVDSYIHRSGRTARCQKSGESLLILLPSEIAIIEQLKKKKVPINKIQVNQNKLYSPVKKLEALLARNVEIKESAQRAVVSYVKGVFLMKDKSVFDVHALNTDAFARSLGLAIPPRIRFLQRHQKKENDDNIESCKSSLNKNDEKEESTTSGIEQAQSSSWKNSNNFKSGNDFILDDDDDDDDLLTVKKKDKKEVSDDELAEIDIEEASQSKNKKAITKASIAKKLLKKKIISNKKITFDEEGQEQIDAKKSKVSEIGRQYEQKDEGGIDIDLAKQILREEDKYDKQLYKEKIKKIKQEAKKKLKAQKRKGEPTDEDEESGDLSDEDSDQRGKVTVKEYNEEGSDSEDDYEGPDLSWLPDPDVVYGKKKGSDEEESNEEEDDEEEESDKEEISDNYKKDKKSDSSELDSDEEQIHRPMKRKLIAVDPKGKKKRRKQESDEEDNANLQADEDLALRLLGR